MLDIVLVIVLLIGLLRGYLKGFIVALTAFLSVGIALWVSLQFQSPFKEWLANHLDTSTTKLTIISYVLVFGLTSMAVNGLARWISGSIEEGLIGVFNRLLGAILLGSMYAGIWLFLIFLAEDGLMALTNYYPQWEEQNPYVAYCLQFFK